MMLPEMTDSAGARAFKRFAQLAAAGLALAGLTACGGGGGSSTPKTSTPTTPEIPITPSAPTSEDFASAIDITGQDTFEGRLDSANRRAFYKIRIDEPTVLVLRSEDDIDITVYDSRGNVVNPYTAEQAAVALSAASAGGGHAVVPAVEDALPLIYLLGLGGGLKVGAVAAAASPYIITITATAAAAAAGVVALDYAVRKGVARLALRQTADLPEVRLGVEGEQEINLEESFDGEAVVTSTWTVTPTITIRPFGTLKLFKVENKAAVRVSHERSDQCPTGTEVSKTVKAELDASWTQSIPLVGNRTLGRKFEISITFGSKAPRRKEGRPNEIAVTVLEGGSETVVLTDEIEDPQGGTLTFAVGPVPDGSGLGVTQNGATLTIAAQDGAMGGTITVTATDPARECWNFPVRVSVEQPSTAAQGAVVSCSASYPDSPLTALMGRTAVLNGPASPATYYSAARPSASAARDNYYGILNVRELEKPM